ncbi:MAG: type IV pilus assembly protein PilM [Chitinivibrionales bacterium]|nr:type IV pilus assembly protein PilM [Chitinivibrionales bacterium]
MNLTDLFRKEVSTVGLDIGNYSLKLAKVSHSKDGYHLDAVGIQELPPDTIQGSEIKNREVLMNAINTLINRCDPSIVEVVISMSGHGIISDRMSFQVDATDNAEELILWEASQRSPFDVEDITLDYKILSRDLESGDVEAFVVAAKNQIMQSYIDLLYDVGLKPVLVDVDAFAVTNAYLLSCGDQVEEGVVALINMGHDLTSITFLRDGAYHSTRDISTAGVFFNTVLQRNLGVTTEEASSIIKGRSNKSIDMDVLSQSIEFAAEELSSGIDLAFSYFKSSEKAESIDKIVLSGGGAYIPNIVPFLEKRHNTVATVANPLAFLQYEPDLFGTINPETISAMMTVAIGCALRKVES